MLLAKQLFYTSDTWQNTLQYWFLCVLMIISVQFFLSFCVCLLSPAASQPGVFSLMAVIIDEVMFPEPANVTPLFFWSLYGIIAKSRMAAFILEPVQFEGPGPCGVSLPSVGPCPGLEGDWCDSSRWFRCLLPECKFRDVKPVEWFYSSFFVTRVPWQQALRRCHQVGLLFSSQLAGCVTA